MSCMLTVNKSLEIGYQLSEETGQGELFIAQTCFKRLLLPLVHKSFDEFEKAGRLSISEGMGYGLY